MLRRYLNASIIRRSCTSYAPHRGRRPNQGDAPAGAEGLRQPGRRSPRARLGTGPAGSSTGHRPRPLSHVLYRRRETLARADPCPDRPRCRGLPRRHHLETRRRHLLRWHRHRPLVSAVRPGSAPDLLGGRLVVSKPDLRQSEWRTTLTNALRSGASFFLLDRNGRNRRGGGALRCLPRLRS